MRLSVECAFPHLGKRDAALRKSAFCLRVSPKSALCVRAATHTAPFREARRRAEICGPSRKPPRRLAGGCSSAFAQLRHSPWCPAAWRGGCPTPPGRRDVTERHILSARLTKRRALRLRRHGNATLPWGHTRLPSKLRPDRPCGGLRRAHGRRLQPVSDSTTSMLGQSSGSYG